MFVLCCATERANDMHPYMVWQWSVLGYALVVFSFCVIALLTADYIE